MFMGHVSLLASKEKQPDINLDEVLLNSTGIIFNFEASLVDQVYFVTSQTCAMFPSLYFDLDFFTTDMSRLITKELAMFCFHCTTISCGDIIYYYQVVLKDSQPDKTDMDHFLSSDATLVFDPGVQCICAVHPEEEQVSSEDLGGDVPLDEMPGGDVPGQAETDEEPNDELLGFVGKTIAATNRVVSSRPNMKTSSSI